MKKLGIRIKFNSFSNSHVIERWFGGTTGFWKNWTEIRCFGDKEKAYQFYESYKISIRNSRIMDYSWKITRED